MTEKKKLWGGRFKKELDEDAKKFSYSLHIDGCLAPYDIQVNLAHAKALHKESLITDEELKKLEAFFEQLHQQFIKNPGELFGDDEDVHSCIERITTEKLGDLGKKIHTGKSRNDQVITDMRLYLLDEISQIIMKLESVMKVLWQLADSHLGIVMPGFTHLQPAQPVLLSHHLLAHFEKFSRDRGRFIENIKSTDVCPLGSGALAGNNYNLDRVLVAEELGFSSITRNSMDSVSDRDFMLEFCNNATICMTHLSQFCEELVIWSSPITNFITIGDDFTTGSSIMPQKKNPDIAELIRGKSGRVLGNYTALVHLIKGLPLTYNRDLQEDKEIVFDSAVTLEGALTCFSKMLDTIVFNQEAIQESLKKGHLLATDFADYLVKKGVPFRESHEITGKVVLYCQENKKELWDLTVAEFTEFSTLVEDDVLAIFNFDHAVNSKTSYGNTATDRVKNEINHIREVFKWENKH